VLSYIPEQFTAILKKTNPLPSDGGVLVLDARTAADYETLRNYATEGGEAHDDIEVELAVFVTHGVTAWISLYRQGRNQGRGRLERPARGGSQMLLAILLVNMIESRGGI
jgi:hypothetical protein